MNQERIRERKISVTAHEPIQTLIEGNIPTMFRECLDTRAIDQFPRSKVVFEIGKRAMRRITRSGKR